MGGDPGIGTEGDRHAGLVGARERVLDQRPDARGLGSDQVGEEAGHLRLLGHPVPGEDGRHVPGVVLLHRSDHALVQVGAVFNRVHAGLDRAQHALGAVRVRGDAEAVVGRGLDHGTQFVGLELGILAAAGQRQHAAGGGDLDQVGTVLVALANRLARGGDAVDDAVARAGTEIDGLGPAVGRVGVAAGGGQRLAGGQDARPGYVAARDGPLQGDDAVVGIAEVAHGREPGIQRAARQRHGLQRVVGLVETEFVEVDVAVELAAQVHVRVHQPGQAAQVVQVHGVGAGRQLGHRQQPRDAAVLDLDRGVGHPAAAADVQHLAAGQRLRRARGGGDQQQRGAGCRAKSCYRVHWRSPSLDRLRG